MQRYKANPVLDFIKGEEYNGKRRKNLNLIRGADTDMEKTRFSPIDMIKTIAVFFVIFYHGTLFSNDFLAEATLTNYLLYFSRTILSTCAPLFFFVNGYLLFGKHFDLRKHIFKMIKMVLQTTAWAIIVMLIFQAITGEHFTLGEFIWALWDWKLGWINYLWYTGALICIYVFFPLLKNAYDTNFRTFLYFTMICVLLTFGNTLINHAGTVGTSLFYKKTIIYNGVNFFNIYNPFRGIYGYTFGYFCIGGIAYHFREAIEKTNVKSRNMIAMIVMLLSCLGLFTFGLWYSKLEGSVWSVVWNAYDTVFTLINVICIYILCLNWKKDCRIIRAISSNTLGIYYIHWVIISVLKPYIQNYAVLMNFSFSLLFSFFVLMVSLMICLVMRKCPIISKLIK